MIDLVKSDSRLRLKGATLYLAYALILGVMVRPISAHATGKMQLASEPAGPYKLTVWTSPDPARVGELHVATAVVLAEDATPVLDAEVVVELISESGEGPALSAPASTDDSDNKFLYEAIFEPSSSGLYLVKVLVTGSNGEVGEVAFGLELEPAAGFDPLWLVPVFLGLGAIVLLWFARLRS
jgi:hypothetical protein